MSTPENNLKNILKEIRTNENADVLDAMERMGLKYNKNFGVSISRLKVIAEKYKMNHSLANQLRKKNIRETHILASMIDDHTLVCEKDADEIVSKITTNELTEQTCINLFEKLDFADKKAKEWVYSKKEFTIVSGFLIISRIALKDKEKKDSFFEDIFDISVNLCEHQSIFVRKSIARALRQIALRNKNLKLMVLETMNEIKSKNNKLSDLIYEEVVPLIDY